VNACPPAFNWRDYLPLAKAETSKFYKKQERGKFRYEELLSVSIEALGKSLGGTYAIKAIRGAITDFVRDSHKLVRNVEMSEEAYLRTWGSPTPPPSAVRRVYVSGRVRHTLYTPGAYRSNAQLLVGDGKVGRHGKVSVALERTTYNDGWSQTSSGWKRAKIEDAENLDYDPRAGRVPPQRSEINQVGYVEQRWSVSYFNDDDVVRKQSGQGDGSVTVTKNGKPFVRQPLKAICRRFAAATLLDVGIIRPAAEPCVVNLKKFGLKPVPKNELGCWREELATEPGLRAGSSEIAWQREAGYFEVLWGCRTILSTNVILSTFRADRARDQPAADIGEGAFVCPASFKNKGTATCTTT
jgi:hypothetical protein